MAKLAEFAKRPSCPKCGDKDVARTYHRREWFSASACVLGMGTHGEHHDMHCRLCGYEWAQQVKKSAVTHG